MLRFIFSPYEKSCKSQVQYSSKGFLGRCICKTERARNVFLLLKSRKENPSFTLKSYRRIEYNLNVMRQSACLVFNPIMIDNYAAFFNCTPVGRASDSTGVFFGSGVSKLFGARGSPSSGSLLNL